MRLLNIHTLEFREFHGEDIRPYVIASHRWDLNEVTYKDVLKKRNQSSTGFQKVQGFCEFVRNHQLDPARPTDWVWLDTCCINHTSSAELSESINSMWEWYRGATHCIAYLRDVRPLSAGRDAVLFDFRKSQWFERGWTLQELLAPTSVLFLTQAFEVIGWKTAEAETRASPLLSLNSTISVITAIPMDVLSNFADKRSSVRKEVKMSWAANRRTTKPEDTSYCLLGIFDVHMPLIYGEGERNARKRLEKEILTAEQEDYLEGRGHGLDNYSNELLPHAESSSVDATNRPSSLLPEDICPVCRDILVEPITTSCNHTMCEEDWLAHTSDNSIRLTPIPLDLDGEIVGDAANCNFLYSTLDFQSQQHCPSCGAAGRDIMGDSTIFAQADFKLSQDLRTRYPQRYAQREARALAARDVLFTLTIDVGNWHELMGPERHRWTFFVKPSRTDVIEDVDIHLHESFKRPDVNMKKPPYVFHGKGWGYFNIRISVNLKAGYEWKCLNAEAGTNGVHQTALKLDWTLDFGSHNGRGAMGRCRVGVRKTDDRTKQTTPFRGSLPQPPASTFSSTSTRVAFRADDGMSQAVTASSSSSPTTVSSLPAMSQLKISQYEQGKSW